MNLGIDFVIYSGLSLSALIPLYIYREKIFKFLYKSSDFETFLTELRKYLLNNHKLINFNFSIVERTETEPNPKTRQILIVEDILSQFSEYEILLKTQNSVEKNYFGKHMKMILFLKKINYQKTG